MSKYILHSVQHARRGRAKRQQSTASNQHEDLPGSTEIFTIFINNISPCICRAVECKMQKVVGAYTHTWCMTILDIHYAYTSLFVSLEKNR